MKGRLNSVKCNTVMVLNNRRLWDVDSRGVYLYRVFWLIYATNTYILYLKKKLIANESFARFAVTDFSPATENINVWMS